MSAPSSAKANMPLLGTYCATKAALMSLGHARRGDLAPHGVRVITAFPGTMETDMSRGFEIPKTSAAKAAAEILQAIDDETIEAPICDDARYVFAEHARAPKALQESFLAYRA